MNLPRSYLLSIPLVLLLVFPAAFAQHHSGQQAPPITFGSGQVTVGAMLTPSDFTAGRDSSVDLNIRFFDTASNVNIESVTYRVQIFYGSDLVANQMFFDKDGDLNIKIQPKSDCQQEELWKCTKYYGESDPIVPNALVSSASSKPVITGPVFDKSGEYTVKTSIIGAKNPKTQTSEDIDFETKLIIPSESQFVISFNDVDYPVSVKNYHESITDLSFDSSSNSLIFKMPFDWNHVGHADQIKYNFELPKNFPPFENIRSFVAKVNDDLMLPQGIHYDVYSKHDRNVIHFAIDNDELKQIQNDPDPLTVTVLPSDSSSFVENHVSFDNGYRAIISYDSAYHSDKDLVITTTFFDQNGDIASDVRYGYSLKDPNGNETFNTGTNPNLLGIELPKGTETRNFGPMINGKYHLQIVLIGLGMNDLDRFKYSEFDFELRGGDAINTPKEKIPSWIKNNAGWWADGSIDDSSFVQGIQFMIKNKLLDIPDTAADSENSVNEIPPWIKNNAKWWADGLIGEDDFLKGIEFLAKSGIIKVS